MFDSMDPLVEAVLIFLGVLAAVTLICAVLGPMSCRAAWRDSGYPCRWTFLGGCQVKVNGGWVPEESVRFGPKEQP